MTIADLNGDGYLDLALGGYFKEGSSIRSGDGHGGFGDATTTLSLVGNANQVCGLETADFNTDGRSDLAVGVPPVSFGFLYAEMGRPSGRILPWGCRYTDDRPGRTQG